MTKKLLALIIAVSMITQLKATKDYNAIFTERRLKETADKAYHKGYDEGFTTGITTSLIASSLAMYACLASIGNNLFFIPSKINSKEVPTGETRWVETINKISDRTTIKTGHSEPVYTTVWEDNPLHTALKNTSQSKTAINMEINENMVQTMSSYMPSALAFTGVCALFGIIYYVTQAHKNKETQLVQ